MKNSTKRFFGSLAVTAMLAGSIFANVNAAGESNAVGTSDGYVWGDVNHDKGLTAADAAYTLQYVLNPEPFKNSTSLVFDESLADVSGNGIIEAYDAACILQKVLDNSYKMPVEKTEETTEATTESATEVTTEAVTEVTTTTGNELVADLSNGIVQGNNDNVLQGLEAGAAMSVKNDSSTGLSYVQGSVNPSTAGTNIKVDNVTVPDAGAYLAYTAPEDGVLKSYIKTGSGKETVFIGEDAKDIIAPIDNITGESSRYDDVEVPLTKGQKVYIFAPGSKPAFYSLSFVVGATVASTTTTTTEATTETTTEETTVNPNAVTLYLFGDSTMCSFNDKYYYPRYGYGTQMDKYFDDDIIVKNLAASGRSSKSYVTDSAADYKVFTENVKAGDYVIIGFGHNDEKFEDARFTNPNTGLDDPTSFQSVIYTNYVKPALDAGATPIICTPIVRRTTGEFSQSQLHNTAGTTGTVNGVVVEGGDYVAAGKALAEAYGLTCIDMTELTKNLYTELTPSETINLHAWTSKNSTSVDNTHLNIYGADVVAYLCTQAIKNSTSTLAEHVLDGATMPDKATVLVPNPDYKETVYSFPQASELWDNVGDWKGTVFGDIGGATKLTGEESAANGDKKYYYDLSAATEGSTNSMNIRAGAFTDDTTATAAGKIASTSDGIAMYYQAVPSAKNFTITATATINKIMDNNQVSFGLMARDAVWTDTYSADSVGDYVAAGSLMSTKAAAGNMYANFCRKSGTLTQGTKSTKTTAYKPGDVVELKIVKNSDGYECTIDGQAVSAGFDFALTSIDSDYVFVGPYVSRAADVTFSNVTLTITD